MKKFYNLLAVCVFALACVMFAACGNDPEPENGAKPTKTTAPKQTTPPVATNTEFSPITDVDEDGTIRIAFIGDSITYGSGVAEAEKWTELIKNAVAGTNYEVKSFGVSATSVAHEAKTPYTSTSEYAASLRYNADVYIILLGTNDSHDTHFWHRKGLDDKDDAYFQKEFKDDYAALINAYQENTYNVIICTPMRRSDNDTSEKIIEEQINPIIKDLHKELGCGLIDVFAETSSPSWKGFKTPTYTHDGLHPNAAGAAKYADFLMTTLGINK